MSNLPPAVASWRDQIERLSELASPCRYLAPAKWKAMRENAMAFIDQHGTEAHRLGWTAPELFGVHPQTSTLRVDSCQVQILRASAAHAIDADRMAFAQTSGYWFIKGQILGIALREFVARGAEDVTVLVEAASQIAREYRPYRKRNTG
ncbi:hypothetical protein MKK88_17615 [Methylobacterium sp. E-005]|uniref:hypothetical protein n=1 Tax=Methylobacterium sp. E-005 TaxID=2836549 RepID=UPI001FB9C9FA|nr:hypothetical protein [Methylobacterium sp. E-005]MCJ2087784.1 hypothetical protein [Methylobacterium sp. E-005]